jgi:hypothetical protein
MGFHYELVNWGRLTHLGLDLHDHFQWNQTLLSKKERSCHLKYYLKGKKEREKEKGKRWREKIELFNSSFDHRSTKIKAKGSRVLSFSP